MLQLVYSLTSEIDNEGWLKTKLYDKRDDFSFLIVNFPFLCSDIPAAPANGVYISQLIDIPGLVFLIMISLIEDCYSKRRYYTKSSKW